MTRTSERFRGFVSQNIASLMFLGFYSLTLVIGNVLYASPIGEAVLRSGEFPTEFLRFPTTFTLGFWLLLLLPYIAVPVLVPPIRRRLCRPVGTMFGALIDFDRVDYLVILAAAYGSVAWALWRTDAFALLANAADAAAAIDARFALQARLHFVEKATIHSIVPFLTFYSMAAALTDRERFWSALAFLNIAATTVILFAMNMKWPVLVFYIGVITAIFMFSRRYAYSKTIIGGVVLIAFYLAVSTYVFRWVAPVPAYQEASISSEIVAAVEPDTDNGNALSISEEDAHPAKGDFLEEIVDFSASLVSSSVENAPLLFGHALNRMSIAFPYYYKVFTQEGPICGTLIETYLPGAKPCAPTFLVYSRIFPDDRYAGEGSSPAAPHITAYAQQGWIGALVGMIGICALLAGFAAIPPASAMGGAWAITGATVGYHLSQIPGEGPVIYDHGILWPLLLVGSYAVVRLARARIVNQKTQEV